MQMAEDQHQQVSEEVVKAALGVAKGIDADGVVVYVEALDTDERLKQIAEQAKQAIFVVRDKRDAERVRGMKVPTVSVPPVNLTRFGQVKMAMLMAFSKRLLKPKQTYVFLTGVQGKKLDTIGVMTVGDEYELIQSVDQPRLNQQIRGPVFERALRLAVELAQEGREGSPVGAIFVIGDDAEVAKYCEQHIINPFKGYPEKHRNILDEAMGETIKNFATLDGAFIVKGTGVIVSCGTHLRPSLAGKDLPQGLGSRHAVAAAITASTKCVAVTVSQSTGAVRVWRRGQMIIELERGVQAPAEAGASTTESGDD
jgi:DNA integrity scanning protein DisA with diadenylate cyclase activity